LRYSMPVSRNVMLVQGLNGAKVLHFAKLYVLKNNFTIKTNAKFSIFAGWK